MSGQHPPLDCAQVKRILKKLGFSPRPRKGTSHEQWVKFESGRIYKVTVDCPKQPFTGDLLSYMIKQSGVSKKRWYELAD